MVTPIFNQLFKEVYLFFRFFYARHRLSWRQKKQYHNFKTLSVLETIFYGVYLNCLICFQLNVKNMWQAHTT